ncbi:hypothetical protein ISF9_063 [Microbacterium phage vB_MoxS-ISF9]|uniref:Uncharacterized protein n=1 Tax=Microbacterium phage vB_MoxS-ISF9 TaxID=1458670 RepID=W8NWN1_9CAUD|nr:hypothetical protein ISF9_063 [Microbacterium phage vB_MoxS-ISF9]AHL18533.1 hypothetical protein ISF9_063 [Microbacterium phage vB_MoxS-ISF9]
MSACSHPHWTWVGWTDATEEHDIFVCDHCDEERASTLIDDFAIREASPCDHFQSSDVGTEPDGSTIVECEGCGYRWNEGVA